MPNELEAKFTQGAIMRHITVMASTGAVGLMAIFLVDLADMFFISLLGQVDLAAAIGFAGTIIFFSTSVSIGTSIATGALVSQALGSKDRQQAKTITASAMLYSALVSVVVATTIICLLDPILALLDAKGETAEKAKDYLLILVPSAPIMAMGMAAGAALRGVGDAKRSMLATLIAGLVNAVLDPVFIFVFKMEIQGAAVASVVARIVIFVFSCYALKYKHDMLGMPNLSVLRSHLPAINSIAIPAVLTNTATPFGNAVVTAQIAKFGADFVAGFAVIGRLTPVAFALIFSLSGAVGPILGQNFGAKRFDRVGVAISDSARFVILYCIGVALILFVAEPYIVHLFGLDGDAAELMAVFCHYIAITFIFNGLLFVSNAAFNNLNRPTWSTAINVGKASIGTIPFVLVGAHYGGAAGVLIGQAVGAVIFGIIGYFLVRRLIKALTREYAQHAAQVAIDPVVPIIPFTACCPDVVLEEQNSLFVEGIEKKAS